MKKIIISFISAFSLFTFTQNIFGATLADSITGVLPGAPAINSQFYLDPPLADYNNSAADDVAVPACESWSTNLVAVEGKYSDPLMVGMLGPAASVSVYVFSDLPGEPDTFDYSSALYVYEGLDYTETNSGDFSIPLPTNAILPGGASGSTYWIAVRANLAVLSGGQWNWSETTIDLGSNVSQWQQSRAGVLTGISDCVLDWKNSSVCGLVGTDNQLAMRIEGTVMTKGITVTPTVIDMNEGGVSSSFDVVLDAPPCDTVNITITGNDATETTISTALLAFNAGNWNVPQTVTLTPLAPGDGNDGTQAYNLDIPAASVGDAEYNGATGTSVNVSVMNFEGIGTITVEPDTGNNVNEDSGSAIVTIAADGVPSADVSVDLTVPAGVSANISTAVLTAGNGFSVPVTITGVPDDVVDGDMPYTITTEPAVSTDITYNGVNPANISGAVFDDDTAGFIVTPTALNLDEGQSDTFSIVLTSKPLFNVVLAVATTDATEALVKVGAHPPATIEDITFTPGNWDVLQIVTVTAVDDMLADGNEALVITTGDPTSTDGVYNALGASDISDVDVVVRNINAPIPVPTLSQKHLLVLLLLMLFASMYGLRHKKAETSGMPSHQTVP